VTLDDDDRTLSLQVVSVTPRVLAMDDFLTIDECQALMALAASQGLKGSTLYAGGMAQQQRDLSTRSSTNTWLSRETSNVTDRIYRRAAQILHMKESLLQQPPFYREDEEDYTQHSIAESLQVVRYAPGEEYAAHHDFVYPSLRHRYQPTRYATLLLYLNDDFTGGQTNFPRAVNPSQHEGISITPKAGKAVLFYNVLPDGNVDDLSQHQSLPVIEGEKWLANLWIWDPVIN
jgi:prolyl 4-hydroxylase